MDRNRYKIGEPPATQDGSAGGSTEETDAAAAAAADVEAEARASLTVRLHQLALFLSVQQTSILKKQVRTLEDHLHVLIAFQYHQKRCVDFAKTGQGSIERSVRNWSV
jgi:hypothetical protein